MSKNNQTQYKYRRTLGATRDLTNLFSKFKNNECVSLQGKQEFQQNKQSSTNSRFQPLKSNMFNDGRQSLNSTPPNEIQNDKGSLLPLSTKVSTSSEDNSVEFSKRFLPPRYVDIQEEIESTLDELAPKITELKKMQQKRIKESFFDEDEDLQTRIMNQGDDITQSIKKCDGLLNDMRSYESKEQTDSQISKNMQCILAERIKNIAMQFRQSEKDHFMKVQELHGDKDSETLLKSESEIMSSDQQPIDTLMQEEEEENIKHKSQEIQRLVNSINDLAIVFKDLSTLVIEQGTILDRIDFNVEHATQSTKQAVVHLDNARKIEKSMRSKNCIICLVVSILVLVLILSMKWSH